MPSAAPALEPEWTDEGSAWAEVERIIGGDPFAAEFLRTMSSVWSKAGTESYFTAIREIEGVCALMHELGPTLSRLRRRIPALESAADGLERHLGRGMSSHGGLRRVPAALGAAVQVFTSLQTNMDKLLVAYAGTAPGKLRERPTALVAALRAAAKRIPAIKPLLTPRGLALYEIATKRDDPCGSETEFTDVRCERWKANLRRSGKGT